MSLNEILQEARGLSRAEQLRLIQALAEELAQTELEMLIPPGQYPIWSPHDSFEAAEALRQLLQDEKPRT